uniref:NADH-ubiquinone oxidoreductase chain 2 n=1 Tax=Claassenia magna TaxID=2898275 RepID=A0A6B9PA04_9NEOP|nr:NADH dehydrogenase subunit 2 [Claassenia magna]WHU31437.1 NADH dehydrogenase subunit 2 [Claassenia magna]
MINTPTKLLFILALMSGTIISISSNSWFGAWIGLEVNLLSFMPLMTNPRNLMTTEASLSYFLTQALASATLLFAVILAALVSSLPNSLLISDSSLQTLISSSLLMKMGAAPFHFWFPGVMEGLSWVNSLILMTWQSVAPLMLLSYNFHFGPFPAFIIIASIAVGSIGGLNQTSLRKILAYSSINHLGWMTAAVSLGENLWNSYFLIYTFLTSTIILILSTLSISHINQTFSLNTISPITKFSIFTSLLSLGGLPPFLGFLPKWIIIQALVTANMKTIAMLMVTTTLMTLFYYLRLGFSAFLFFYSENIWAPQPSAMDTPTFIALTLSAISALGLLACSVFYHTL